MEYVKDESGNIKVGDNGNPMVNDGSSEYELDAIHLNSKIPDLQKEAKNHRLKAKELQEKLDQFEGIDDPKQAREALKTVQNMEDKKLIDAGKAEEMKKQIQDQYESKIGEKDQELSKRDQQIHQLVVSNAFANSKTVNDQTILPPDVAEAYFGKHFKVEDGRAVAYDHSGNPIYSREKPGEPAAFDEALQEIVNNHPQKDKILKAAPGGSGTTPGGGAPSGAARSRKDLRNAKDKAAFISKHGRDAYEKLPDE